MSGAPGDCTVSDSAVYTPAGPADNTAISAPAEGASVSPSADSMLCATATSDGSDATSGAGTPASKSATTHSVVPGCVGRGVRDGVRVPGGVPLALGREPLALGVALLLGVPLTDADAEPLGLAVRVGDGRMIVTTTLSTSSDELPADAPPALTTEKRSHRGDNAGGSTAAWCIHPERPYGPTRATLVDHNTTCVVAIVTDSGVPPAASATTSTSTAAESLRKSRAANNASHDTVTASSGGASSASVRLVGSPAAPAVSTAKKAPSPEGGASVKLRPGTASSSVAATCTSAGGAPTSGPTPAAGPPSNEYAHARHGATEADGVGVRVADAVGVPVWLGEPVLVGLPVPVELLEPVPVELDEPVPVWLPVPVELLEPVPVALVELEAVDDPVDVSVTDCVDVMVADSVAVMEDDMVGVMDKVCVSVPLAEGVPVKLDDAVLVGLLEPVPVLLGEDGVVPVGALVVVALRDDTARWTASPRRTGSTASHSAARASPLTNAALGMSSLTLAYRKQLAKPAAGTNAPAA